MKNIKDFKFQVMKRVSLINAIQLKNKAYLPNY